MHPPSLASSAEAEGVYRAAAAHSADAFDKDDDKIRVDDSEELEE